ncbi:Ser/Thr protein phosphatase [Tritrichomonas foetus]|uniref:Serine/threonine-protein phosphatase n=1 Tax=Tritrichomonas foetus TaxID=1144522 RepID=A0A1J4K6Z5_9EUKA|nr:Ser/Thr protein phosphatase [Tritrichomonas foetus]|eukprot:OHT06754.1 Ser/Thr protein phosphatase [Tritrichomonas foetus]
MNEDQFGRGIADKILSAYAPILSLKPDKISDLGIAVPIPTFNEHSVTEITNRARDTFMMQETLIDVPQPVYVIGDLHGNIFDLIRILVLSGPPPSNRFLFLGDYVDRGQYSVEIITLLFALLSKYPDHFFLLRGNHEFARVNAVYGFKNEVETLYKSNTLYESINKCFNYMPLAAVVGSQIFCVHGGISPQISSFRQLKRVRRPIPVYDNNVACDLTWSDPSMDTKEFLRSQRGNGVAFGVHAVRDFQKSFNVKHILRAHQCVQLGIERFAGDALYTIFSCSNYQDANGNRCGIVFIQENGRIQSFSLPPINQVPRENALMAGEPLPGQMGGEEDGFEEDKTQSLKKSMSDSTRSSLLCFMQPQTSALNKKRSLSILGMNSHALKNSQQRKLPSLAKVPEMDVEMKPRPGTAEPILPPLKPVA